MDAETNAVLFNAVPLLLLAALSLTAAVLRTRARRSQELQQVDAAAYVAGGAGVAAAILGVAVLLEREPLAGSVWVGLVAILAAAAPLALVLARRATAAEQPQRQPGAAERLSAGVADVPEQE